MELPKEQLVALMAAVIYVKYKPNELEPRYNDTADDQAMNRAVVDAKFILEKSTDLMVHDLIGYSSITRVGVGLDQE